MCIKRKLVYIKSVSHILDSSPKYLKLWIMERVPTRSIGLSESAYLGNQFYG